MREQATTRKTICKPLVWTLVSWFGLAVAGPLRGQEPFEEFSCASFPADLSEAGLINGYGVRYFNV